MAQNHSQAKFQDNPAALGYFAALAVKEFKRLTQRNRTPLQREILTFLEDLRDDFQQIANAAKALANRQVSGDRKAYPFTINPACPEEVRAEYAKAKREQIKVVSDLFGNQSSSPETMPVREVLHGLILDLGYQRRLLGVPRE